MPRQRLRLTVAILRVVPRHISPALTSWWRRVVADAQAELPVPAPESGSGPSSPPAPHAGGDWYATVSGRSGPPEHWLAKVRAGAPQLLEPEPGDTGAYSMLLAPSAPPIDPSPAALPGPAQLSAAAAAVAVTPSPPSHIVPQPEVVERMAEEAGLAAGRGSWWADRQSRLGPQRGLRPEPLPPHPRRPSGAGVGGRWLRQAAVRVLNISTEDLPAAHSAQPRSRPSSAAPSAPASDVVAAPSASTTGLGYPPAAPAAPSAPAAAPGMEDGPWADHPSVRPGRVLGPQGSLEPGRALVRSRPEPSQVGEDQGSGRRQGATHLALHVPGVSSPNTPKAAPALASTPPGLPFPELRPESKSKQKHVDDPHDEAAPAIDPWPALPRHIRPEREPDDVAHFQVLELEQRGR